MNSLNVESNHAMRRAWIVLAGVLAALLAAAFTVAPVEARPPGQDGRPILPDPQTYGTENFLIHYAATGPLAVDPTDSNSSGVPDYVELVAETLEYTWTVQIDGMGWPPPPGDRGEGGDTRIDVYLDAILQDGYAGYVDTTGGFLGDNPRTPEQERRAAYAFMVLDMSYAGVDPDTGHTPTQLMQATVAHEFNHIIQAGIDDRDLHGWLYEATATWMEDEVFPDVNDGVFYLDSVFKSPDVCLVAEEGRGDDTRWYGSWLLLRLMSERYGPEVVRTIWENMRVSNGFDSIDAALAPHGSSLVAESRDYAVANLLRAYREGYLYPTVRVEAELGQGSYTPNDGVQGLGADYVRVVEDGPLAVSLVSAGSPITVRAVGVRGAEAHVFEMAGSTLHLDAGGYDDFYLVIHNDEMVSQEAVCIFANYTLDISPSSALPSPVVTTWPTEHFVSPLDAPVTGTGASTYRPPDVSFGGRTESAITPEGLNVSFETLLPDTLPPGYAFDYAYVMTDADFGENAIYYVPGGGDSANFDYLDQQGNWLSIAESPSPYATVQQWIDGIQYTDTPGTVQAVDGVDVLLEDLSDAASNWYSATLILDGLFIVVDGDHTEDEVIQLVQSLIRASRAQAAPTPPPAAPTLAPLPQVTAAPPPAPTPPASGVGGLLLTTVGLSLCAAGLCVVALGGLLVLGVMLLWRRK